jgi:hypothetical protein
MLVAGGTKLPMTGIGERSLQQTLKLIFPNMTVGRERLGESGQKPSSYCLGSQTERLYI